MSGEYVGLVARCYDKDNLVYTCVDVDANEIRLYQRKNGVDTQLGYATATGFSTGAWYYLRLRVHYGGVWVHRSTDGINWVLAIDKEFNGVQTGTVWTWASFLANMPMFTGRYGYIGLGFSDAEDAY